MWNIVLSKIENNTIVGADNNPEKSGRYLCTCISMNIWYGKESNRYLQVMEYDAKRNYWHDCGNPSGVSHNVLAWTDKVQPCDFKDFEYVPGGFFIEKE